MAKNKLRPMGKVTADLETVLDEMTDPKGHDMQWHEVLGIVEKWLQVHAPHAQETYLSDDSHPVYYYGHRKGLK